MLIAHVRAQLAAGISPCLPPVCFAKLAAHVPSWRKIIKEVADKYELTPADLTGPERRRMYAWPRHEAMWRCRMETNMSLPEIGRRFGGRDHTSCIYAIEAHGKRLAAKTFPAPSTNTRPDVDHRPLPVLAAE